MYTRFEILNFRGFEHLTIEPLARVNLIAGKNNVGYDKRTDRVIQLRSQDAQRLDYDLQLHNFGGDSELPGFLKALALMPGFDDIASLAIIRDAEADPQAAFHIVIVNERRIGAPKTKTPRGMGFRQAERVGFEPTIPFGIRVFETRALGQLCDLSSTALL